MYKLQVACIIILCFIGVIYYSSRSEKSKKHQLFCAVHISSIVQILLDIATVYTVNHLESVPAVVNQLLHRLFLGDMLFVCYMIHQYLLILVEEEIKQKLHHSCFTTVWTGLSLLGIVVLPLYYKVTPQGNYSYGPAVSMVYTGVAALLVFMGINFMMYHKRLPQKKRYAISMALVTQIVIALYQFFVPTALLSGLAITLMNLGIYITVENPDARLVEMLEKETARADAASAAKSMFLANMSHEIRTPMNAIVGMTDILLRGEHSKQTREYLNNIKNSGEALLNIINDILDFSKIEFGTLEIVEEEYEPMSMFHDMSMIFLNRIGDKKIELLYDIDKNLPVKLYGDARRLRQIIINLMNNAIKFTESGYVRLSVEAGQVKDGNMELTFRVEDTGQGIREEDIGKLFDSFQQVDNQKNYHKEGTGLGLAISKQLVELMHGSIGVKSSYGEGSTFYFTVSQKVVNAEPAAVLKAQPGQQGVLGIKVENKIVKKQLKQLAQEFGVEYVDLAVAFTKQVDYIVTDDRKSVSEEERKQLEKVNGVLCVLQNPMIENISEKNITILNKPVYSLNFCQLMNHEDLVFKSVARKELQFTAPKAQILVVDDNEMNLKVAKGLLAPYKMQIDTAADGKEALLMVQKKRYDMVFMDHMMPIMDGIEATREIRKLQDEFYRKMPIVALSANATSEAREMFLEEKMDDFVAKPIKPKEIAKCILRWLPKELIEGIEIPTEDTKPVEEQSVNQPEKNQEELQEELPVIEGLDVLEGIKNCGSKKLFLELLGDFYKTIDSKSTKLEKCLADGMIRDYTIEVHALKNTARMIGAMELSELFYQMEQLGNAGEQEQIEMRTPQVLKLYRSYKEILTEYGRAPRENQIQVSSETMCQTLMRLHDAVDVFDLDEADRAMKELETYIFPADMQTMVEQLSAYVADVAMEDIIRMTENMCAELKAAEPDER